MTTPGDQFVPTGWTALGSTQEGKSVAEAARVAVEAFYGTAPGVEWGSNTDGVMVRVPAEVSMLPAPDPRVRVEFMGVHLVRHWESGMGVDVLSKVLADGVERLCMVSLRDGGHPTGSWVVEVAPGFFP